MKYGKINQQLKQTPINTPSSSNAVRANIEPHHWLELTFDDNGPTKYSIVSYYENHLNFGI